MPRVFGEHGKMYTRLPKSKEAEIFGTPKGASPIETCESDTPLMPSGLGKASASASLLEVSPERKEIIRPQNVEEISKMRRGARAVSSLRCRIFGIVMFCVFVLIYCFVTLVLQPLIDKGVRHSLILRPNDSDEWEHPKADIFAKVHFFNVTNPEEAINEEQPFKLKETGPYVYRIVSNKMDIVWNSNSTVSYRERNLFSFEPSLSSGDEEDIVRIANVLFLTMSDRAQSGKMQSWISSLFQSGTGPFTSRSVKDFLWGYEDNILTRLNYLKSLDVFKFFMELDEIPEKFGFLAPLNSTPTSVYNVYTGDANFSQLNEVYSYDYKKFLHKSFNNEKVRIHGSACGAIFPPPLKKMSNLSFFFGPLFKNFDLEFHQPSSYRGLHTYSFKIPGSQFTLRVPKSSRTSPVHVSPPPRDAVSGKTMTSEQTTPSPVQNSEITSPVPSGRITSAVASGKNVSPAPSSNITSLIQSSNITSPAPSTNTTSPLRSSKVKSALHQMRTYLKKMSSNGSLRWMDSNQAVRSRKFVKRLKGIASMEPLSKGAPIFFSFPHFWGADAKLREKIEGLSPDEDLHRSSLDIHTVTGVTSHFRLRYQINALLDLKKLNKKTNGSSRVFLPLFWIETTARLDKKSLNKLHSLDILTKGMDSTTIVTFSLLCALAGFLLIQLLVGLIQHATDKHSTFIIT